MSLPGLVFTAGDNAYDAGSAGEFKKCYDPTWGRFKGRTHPAVGNHDIRTANGAPDFAYFGPVAGTPLDGWYSFQAGSWHVVVLNSNCLGGDRLRRGLPPGPLAARRPRRPSGRVHAGDLASPAVQLRAPRQRAGGRPVLARPVRGRRRLVINGHEHDYERFAPQDPDGLADPAKGIREIVVGTGGAELRPFKTAAANSRGPPTPGPTASSSSSSGRLATMAVPEHGSPVVQRCRVGDLPLGATSGRRPASSR